VQIKDLESLVLNLLSGSTQTTGSSGGNQTDLLTGRGITLHGRRVSNVLVVTSSVRVIHRVHSHTTNLGPAVTLGLVLVVDNSGLQEGLVDTTTSSDETDDGTGVGRDVLLGTRGKTDLGDGVVIVVRDDGGKVSRASGERSSVSDLTLDVADDGTFGQLSDGKDISHGEGGLLSGVDELSGVCSLGGDEKLLVQLVLEGVSEDDLSEGSSTSGIVDDVLDDSFDVAVSLSKVQDSVVGGTLSVVVVGLEDSSSSLSLCSDNSTHVELLT